MGIIPAGAYLNAKFAEGNVLWGDDVPENLRDVIADPSDLRGLVDFLAGKQQRSCCKVSPLVGRPLTL